MTEGRPISYMALEPGTPVLSTTGEQFGTVEHVLQVPELDLFDGLAVNTPHHGHRFVDRDQVVDITTAAVTTTIADDQVDALPAPADRWCFTPTPHVTRVVAFRPVGSFVRAASTGKSSSNAQLAALTSSRPASRMKSPSAGVTAVFA